MTKAKFPPRSQPPSSRPPAPTVPAPRAPSPPSTQSPTYVTSSLAGHPHEDLVVDAAAAAAAAAAKKKKKKGKAKKTDEGFESIPTLHPYGYGQSPAGQFTATAQAQADLLSTASELYRRMEADPQGIPDDDAYWTSLPAHLRTFIRNALPLGQLPASAQAVISPNDVNARQASTQAMIAVAQQLAQAAHASQRHLQQHSPGTNSHPSSAFSSVPFDPSVFADLALNPEQAQTLTPHLLASPNSPRLHHSSHTVNNLHAHGLHHHQHRQQVNEDQHIHLGHYSSAKSTPNPPPTRPPGEPLPAPVVLVNEFDADRGDFEDEYYSDDELDTHDAVSLEGARENGLDSLSNGINGLLHPSLEGEREVEGISNVRGEHISSTKKKNKKKKKKGGAIDVAAAPTLPPPPPPPPLGPILSPQSLTTAKFNAQNNVPSHNPNGHHQNVSGNNHNLRATTTPAPSSRAAGKQPMTFSSTAAGKAPAGVRHSTTNNGVTHAHGHGQGTPAAAPGSGKRTVSTKNVGHPGAPASINGIAHGHSSGGDRGQQAQSQQQHTEQDANAWSSSSAEEREKIKEFWLCLNDKERRSLLKIEKEAVLRRIRDQQKHLCSCRVCGRKRHAIEDELDVLYEAYYVELEQYASHQQQYAHSGGTIPPPPGPGPFPGSVALDSSGAVIGGNSFPRSTITKARGTPHTRVDGHTQSLAPASKKTAASMSPGDDDGYDDDELEDDEYEDEYEDEEDEEEDEDLDEPETKSTEGPRRRVPHATNKTRSSSDSLFSLGSSLTVKGGILTVADDLLKNDGQKFLEMMEQLAERRSVREDEVRAIVEAHEVGEENDEAIYNAQEGAEDEEAGDEEEDEEDEDAEEEEEEGIDGEIVEGGEGGLEGDDIEDIDDPEARMEEGRRMFQIFAARMFEQRVLQAYREKVAQERQLQLLRELEAEDQAEKEKEAKKQKENQKKKDKKKQAKQQKEEERQRLESEKAAEAAATKEKLEKQREAELKRQEEIRLRREAERRAQVEEKARKEEERRKRQEEERVRDGERERKKREKEEKTRADREKRMHAEAAAKHEKEQKNAGNCKKAQEQSAESFEGDSAAVSCPSSSVPSSSPSLAAASRKIHAASGIPSSVTLREIEPSDLNDQPSVLTTPESGHMSTSSRRSTVSSAPRSPAPMLEHSAANHRGIRAASIVSSLQSSPSQNGAPDRAVPFTSTSRPQPPSTNVRSPASFVGNSSSGATIPIGAPSLSSLPAPPQGLPPRPAMSLVPPISQASHGQNVQHSAFGSNSLPRPPINAQGGNGNGGAHTSATASAPGLATSLTRSFLPASPSAIGQTNGSTQSPPVQTPLAFLPLDSGHQETLSSAQQASPIPTSSSSPFTHSIPPLSAQQQQQQQQSSVGVTNQQHGALSSPRYGSSQFGVPVHSPTASSTGAKSLGGSGSAYGNYISLGSSSIASKAGTEALSATSPMVSSAAASLASLNLGALNPAIGGHQQPIGPPPGHIRNTSITAPAAPTAPGSQLDDLAFRSSPRAGAIGRPTAIGPIGPVGRHRDLSHEEMANSSSRSRNSSIGGPSVGGPIGGGTPFAGSSGLTTSSAHFGTGISSSRSALSPATLPNGILGSSALEADDDFVQPQLRRTGQTSAIGSSASTQSYFGGASGPVLGSSGIGNGNNGPPSAGASSTFANSSPWAPTFGTSHTAPRGSPSGVSARGAPGPMSNVPGGITSHTAPGLGVGASRPTGSSAPGSVGSMTASVFSSSTRDPWSRVQSGWDRARFAFEQPSPVQQQQHDSSIAHSHNLFGAPGSGLTTPSSAPFRQTNERDRL